MDMERQMSSPGTGGTGWGIGNQGQPYGPGGYPGYPGYPWTGGFPWYPGIPGFPGFPGGPQIPGPGPYPGSGSGQGPGMGGQVGSPPTTPPPNFTPQRPQGLMAVDPGAIAGCRYRFVYIWQTNGRSYWAYLTFVGRNSAAGYRWSGFNWVYFGIDLRFIEQFYCYR